MNRTKGVILIFGNNYVDWVGVNTNIYRKYNLALLLVLLTSSHNKNMVNNF